MILSKDSNNNWIPTAGGNGTFIGTTAAFNAIKDTLPDNTVAYITDDGNGDLQPIDAVTNGEMRPVTSNAVYDKLNVLGTIVAPNVYDVPATGSYGWNYGVWEGTVNLPKGTYLVHVITPNAGAGSVAGTGFSCIVEGQFPAGYSNRIRSGLKGWSTGDVYPIDFEGFLYVPTSGSFTFNFNVYTNGGSFAAGNVYIDIVRLSTN